MKFIKNQFKYFNFTFNEKDSIYYFWSIFVVWAFFYNLLMFPVPMLYQEFYQDFYSYWIVFNVLTDFINLIDLFVQSRKGDKI